MMKRIAVVMAITCILGGQALALECTSVEDSNKHLSIEKIFAGNFSELATVKLSLDSKNTVESVMVGKHYYQRVEPASVYKLYNEVGEQFNLVINTVFDFPTNHCRARVCPSAPTVSKTTVKLATKGSKDYEYFECL